MSSNGFIRATFGELLESRDERLPNDGTHPLYSLTIKDGVTPKTDRYEREFLVTNKESKRYKIIRTGDLVYNPSNLRWGAIATSLIPFPVLASPIYEIFCPKDNKVLDPYFLGALASSPMLMAKYLSLVEGTLVERTALKKDDFLDIEVELPPLPEQKKIAEMLSGVDNTMAKLKLKAQKLDALHFSLAEELAEVLHRDGELSVLQESAEIRTGIAKNSNNEGDMAQLPYMRVANVQDGYLDLGEIKTINVEKGRIARYLLQKGDVLINEGGDLDKVGRGVIWHGEIRECLHQNHVFAVRCSERLMPEFLSLLLKTSYSKNYFLGCAKQTTNLASINSTQLKSFPIPLPSLSAQKEFVDHISSIKQSTSSVSSKISSLAAMKNAISSDLLSGRKRVTL